MHGSASNGLSRHSDSLEKQWSTVQGETLAFEGVDVARPSNGDDKSLLRLLDVNLAFPNRELSVVHGKKGSGKSLLLAALLGEAVGTNCCS